MLFRFGSNDSPLRSFCKMKLHFTSFIIAQKGNLFVTWPMKIIYLKHKITQSPSYATERCPGSYIPLKWLFDPFVPNARFLYPLKISRNRRFWCFQWVEKSAFVTNWLINHLIVIKKFYICNSQNRGLLNSVFESNYW